MKTKCGILVGISGAAIGIIGSASGIDWLRLVGATFMVIGLILFGPALWREALR